MMREKAENDKNVYSIYTCKIENSSIRIDMRHINLPFVTN